MARFNLTLQTEDGATLKAKGECSEAVGFALYLLTSGSARPLKDGERDDSLRVASRSFAKICQKALEATGAQKGAAK